jgi:hypothetical protein
VSLRIHSLTGHATAAVIVFCAIGSADELPSGTAATGLFAQLVQPDREEVARARRDVQAALEALRRQLGERAIGVVLEEELEVEALAAELARPQLDAAALGSLERPLRRVVPGPMQESVDRLRSVLVRLARLVRLGPEGIAVARQSAAVLVAHDRGVPVDTAVDADLRLAFQTLSAVVPDRDGVASLRRRVSSPNASTYVSRAFVEFVSPRRIEQPVEFRETKGGATIIGTGRVAVALRATAPASARSNAITLHAAGGGSIAATADRRRVHVRASAAPRLTGAMQIDLLPDRVQAGPPRIAAAFHTSLAGVRIDGPLGGCRLVQRLASQAIEQSLAANDPLVARRIEVAVARRVEEEGHSLAQRINGLLRHGIWERLAALDYVPEVRSWNDSRGLHAETFYAHDDELGALWPPPAIPSAEAGRLDVVSRVHESAINNTFSSLGGLALDENTVRGIWEVQLKLTSPEWEGLAAGRVPAVVTFAEREPVVVRLQDLGADVTLRVTSCTVEGRVGDTSPREIRFRYQLERDATGMRFVRQPFDYAGTVPADTAAAWEAALGLFFPREIVPLPRYRPSGFSQYLRTTHLDVSQGWLTVGGSRVEQALSADAGVAAVAVGEVRR